MTTVPKSTIEAAAYASSRHALVWTIIPYVPTTIFPFSSFTTYAHGNFAS